MPKKHSAAVPAAVLGSLRARGGVLVSGDCDAANLTIGLKALNLSGKTQGCICDSVSERVFCQSVLSRGFNRVVYSFAFYMTLGHVVPACLFRSDQMLQLEHGMDFPATLTSARPYICLKTYLCAACLKILFLECKLCQPNKIQPGSTSELN